MLETNAGLEPMRRIADIARELMEQIRADNRENGGRNGKHIPRCLLVEDNADDAMLSSRALHSVGAEVVVCMSGDAAIEELRRTANPLIPDFDIVFLDLSLVGSTAQGVDVLRYLKATFPKVHIVIVSGHIDESLITLLNTIKQKTGGGYVGMVSKPLEEIDVSEIMGKHRMVE